MSDSEVYEAMLQACRETARGRWFLAEIERRARTDETMVLLDAVRRLERAVRPAGLETDERPASSSTGGVRDDLFAREILDAAEHIQETAWTMREAGSEPRLCDRLDAASARLYSACATRTASSDTEAVEAGQGSVPAEWSHHPLLDGEDAVSSGERLRLLP